ncbi:MAG: hypothetical protein R3202_09500, partial [Candidatus Competibacterales bacterium]|nr:hypothetical protein [Candidatus Competibacterales bacterium]
MLLAAVTATADTGSRILPPPDRLLRHHLEQLAHEYAGVRRRGWVGLERLGAQAKPAVPALLAQAARETGFLELLAYRILARIGTPSARRAARMQARAQPELLAGAFPVIAARVALIGALNPDRATLDRATLRRLDPVLPVLYNTVRGGGHLDERLLAAWALYAIGTPVTRETAGRALPDIAAELHPLARRYAAALDLSPLLPPAALPPLTRRLKALLRDY